MKKLSRRQTVPIALYFLLVGWSFLGAPAPAAAFSGTEGASFLEIPVGARPAALGSAYAAEAADAYAPVYNPGGLGLLNSTQLAGMHVSYLESINYEYLTFVHPVSIGNSIGASIQYLNPGRTTERDNLGNATGDFSGHYAAFSLAYGRHLGNRIGVGATARVIQSQIADASAIAYGGDVGMMLRANSHWAFGAVVSNIGSSLKFIEQEDPLPLAYRLGASWTPSRFWTLVGEGIYRRNGLASVHGGIEWNPLEIISLRAGYRTDTLRELSGFAGFTTGVGFHVFGQEFGYSWVPVGELGATHYFSLVLRFTTADRERRNLIYYRPDQPEEEDPASAFYDPPMLDLESTPRAAQTEGNERTQ